MRFIESSTTKLDKKSPTCLAGEFAIFDSKNQNGRIYPRDVYENALSPLMEKVKSRSLLGECDHPLSYDEVRLSNVSHVITEMHVEDTPNGRKVFGEVELLDTPAGKVVQALVDAGVPIGISSRAIGDSVMNGDVEEVTDMTLITYDLVADPSFKTAMLSETAKSKLGESLKLIERKVPLNESREYNPTRSMIKSIRESLLRDSTGEILNTSVLDEELKCLRSMLDQKVSEVKSLRDSVRQLSESCKGHSHTLRTLRSDLKTSNGSLENLRINMTKLQEGYDKLAETTVSKSDYDSLLSETVELRKKLAVESRGLTYSQVRSFLEGSTTEEEINSRLDTLSKRSSSSSIVRELETMVESTRETTNSSVKSGRGNPLSSIISRV